MAMSKVMVSIICTNYNKGNWIADAIESFLRQEVDFEYEILLIDDKSTDGSQDIIRDYAARYPNKIRAFYNSKNLGITKTWIKICKEARGKYIARCDGDDFWIDDHKLRKQVGLLEDSKGSEWCTTDYHIVSLSGETIQPTAVASGIIDCPRSYAEMFATKGMTMASTWLVGSQLMKDINANVNKSAVDDTFNIQLDLFRMTELTFLEDATAAFRMNEGSDSRPTDRGVARRRDERLLETQLEYLDKYRGVDYEEIIKVLLRESTRFEELSREGHDRLRLIDSQREHIEALEKLIVDRDAIIQQKEKQLSDLLESKKYKIGKAVAIPVTAVRKVLSRGGRI